jgi:DNA invertase Pin-like site-specific DNA recombinase
METTEDIARRIEQRLQHLHAEEVRLVKALETLRAKENGGPPTARPRRRGQGGESNADRIKAALADGQTRTVSEIAKLVGIERSTVAPTLTRMERRGEVRHEGSLWSLAEVPAQT